MSLMLDKIVSNVERNKYLHAFVQKVEHLDSKTLRIKIKQDGPSVITDVLAYSLVLERLVVAMKNDLRVLEVCHEIWSQNNSPFEIFEAYDNLGATFTQQVFGVAKIFTLRNTVEQAIRMLKRGRVDPSFMGIN